MKAPVDYKAADSIVFDMENKTLYLFHTSEVKYEEITLKADSIAVDFENSILHASGLVDSSGKKIGTPEFEDGSQKGGGAEPYNAKEMSYNFKTQKGKVRYARTKLNDEYVHASHLKLAGKTDDGKDILYIKDGKFTSCDAEEPHYYIKSRKLKVISGKKIISGPLMVVVEDLTLPIVLPFGYFPNQEGKRSGILLPEYGESPQRGFFLRNGGFYWAVNDYLGMEFRGDIFTKGGWRLDVASRYNLKYKLNGLLRVEYGVRKFGEKTDPDFSGDRTFQVTWNHNQTISPTASLTSNVQFGTSSFLQVNSYEASDFLRNTLASSISLNKTFANSPYRLSVNLKHDQNNTTRQMTLGLPEVVFTRSRAFPFKKKTGSRKKSMQWLDNLGWSYTFNFVNRISAVDSLIPSILFSPQNDVRQNVFDSDSVITSSTQNKGYEFYRAGVRQSIPISTKLTLFKFLNVNPSFTYNEYWYFNTLDKDYSETSDTLTYETGDEIIDDIGFTGKTVQEITRTGILNTDTVWGFFATRDLRFNLSTNTLLYGFYQFLGKRKATIRHTIIPSFGYSYKPDFSEPKWNTYSTVQSDTAGTSETYNRFQNGPLGSPGAGESQSLNFGLQNRLELKFLKKGDLDTLAPKDRYRKINLLDNIGFSGSYNFAADSLNLSPISMQARTSILNNKVNLQLSGSLDPYDVNDAGRRINQFLWNTKRQIGRISRLTFTASATLRPTKKRNQSAIDPELDDWTEIQLFRSQYVDFDIPWNVGATYTLNYSNNGINKDTVQTLRFNGDINLTPKWKIGVSSGFDFENKEITFTQISLYRDLHCWEMSLNWTPFGTRKSFIFTLNVKSPTLKDLKVTKRSDFRDSAF